MRLEAVGLCYQYPGGNREILHLVSMAVESRERVGILAPSGFGKTTLCKILAGYVKPDQGAVLLDGRPRDSFRGYCPVQMVWQHPEQAVNPRLRMKKILEEGGPVEPRILQGLGIEPEWDERFPSELSGGELQRYCIARALNEKTRFLIADEISAMLDLITQSQLWNFLLEETKMRGIGMVIVSHSAPLLDLICTRQLDLTMEWNKPIGGTGG